MLSCLQSHLQFFHAWLEPDELIMTSANNEKPPLRFLIKNGEDASFVSFDIKEDVHLTGKKVFMWLLRNQQMSSFCQIREGCNGRVLLSFFPIKPNFKHICQNYDSSNWEPLDEQ